MDDLIEQVGIGIRLYADDATLYVAYDDAEHAKLTMNENLEKVITWATKWKVIFNPEKTISMNFTRKREPSNIIVTMANTAINPSPSHKHLGIILQSSGKWAEHIGNLICRAKRRIDILRSLKWKLDRKSLGKLYIAYVRPILENGNSVWVNCTKQEGDNLENQQLEAARIVTGAKKGTSHFELYRETGWIPLGRRRVNQCLTLLYKMTKNEAAEQLMEMLPQRAGHGLTYNIRSGNDLQVPRARSTAHQNSFLPSTCKAWNRLPPETKWATSTEEFKEKLKGTTELTPPYYNDGERKQQVVHCQLRVRNANLNGNLYAKGMAESPECICGEREETTEHYLLHCPLFHRERCKMLAKLPQGQIVTSELLTHGNKDLSNKTNSKIVEAVHEYLKSTGRFE